MLGAGFDGSFGFGPPGTLDLFYGSTEAAADEAAFKLLQGASFVLASVTFDTIMNGVSPLTLSVAAPAGTFLSDWAGNELAADSANGSVCVSDPTLHGVECAAGPPQVPEPATLTLLGLGVSALVAVRRRRAAQPRA